MKNLTRAKALITAVIVLVVVSLIRAEGPISETIQKDATKMTHASGTFEVKLNPQDDKSGDATLGRMTIDKQFKGDLEGTGKGQMLTAGTAIKGSAGYVAIEKVSGTLKGRKGSFVLQHSGTLTRGEGQLTITVVPDSGTDQLEGLTGKMMIKITDGKHYYEFEYTLAESVDSTVMDHPEKDTLWYQPNLDVYLNRWFASYAEARSERENKGGFLLPYKHHFFVCDAEVIRALGLEPDDPDWEKIKRDVAQPVDMEAYERLCQKRENVVGREGE